MLIHLPQSTKHHKEFLEKQVKNSILCFSLKIVPTSLEYEGLHVYCLKGLGE